MSSSRFLVGDVFERLSELPDSSVDLVLTSPPFLALRSYLPPDHPNKGREIGSELTPADFLATLLSLTAELERVLTPFGSIAVELGDTYSGSGGGGGDYLPGGIREGQQQFAGAAASMRESNAAHWRHKAERKDEWPPAKSLCLIPELYAACLAYGRNVLNGDESPAGEWRVRNLVRWCRPNPPVGALGDKFRPATSTMTIACKSKDRWFDLDAVRTPGSPNSHAKTARGIDSRPASGKEANDERRGGNFSTMPTIHRTDSAPPLDWWEVATEPYKGSHYATWPRKLLVRPIEAMCPREVCRTCGEPRRRIVERCETEPDGRTRDAERLADYGGTRHGNRTAKGSTVGWTDCGHADYRRGVVLDPFAGSGTTLAVANGLGRDAIGVDIDERNADLARERCGMFLEVEE